ncbi:hypothetical protein FPHOBKDP_00223 [Listeria phage LPJP1]|nr:hypothetical protein FPHOBKDP_00223 [Listeria phage LPJP1]
MKVGENFCQSQTKIRKKIIGNYNINENKYFNPYRLENSLRNEPMVKAFPMVFVTTPKLNLTD